MVEISLECAIVGQAGTFDVDTDDSAKVSRLKKKIKVEKKNDLKDVDADKLQLFLAKKANGKWLDGAGVVAVTLDGDGHPQGFEQMDPTLWINNDKHFGKNFGPAEGEVHVLVVVPGQRLPIAAAANHEPHPARKKRWEELNEVLDRNKKAKVNAAGESSTGYSYVSFSDVDRVMRARRYEQSSKVIEIEKIDVLHAYLLLLTKAFGEIVTGKEAKRLHFIVPILACVCGLFDGEVRILAEETVIGKRVHGDGSFEFVIERGSKRVCIVEAKRDDFQQGLAQAYVGCEVLADVEGLTKLYSIVTNFKEWYFSRSLDDKVERDDATIDLEHDIPTRESVKRIAEKIYSMLSEDD
ncbi:hypothetical protein PC129_g22197 [Phytophthora cactorum]|uniref:Crinkler effector protein N-terminal domain-containing protein n=1 Tax=Phytophthora cactorum TaxID=29920 RepID=A0A329R9M3_9STRA|nr:hypothetical protein Pcac1_g22782 [Phytophthora cactorum]KAG2809720.1 hypothetical protein PC113_g23843 [Phytophthora cactorum]KAG2875258.1 hypothetical protein PC115_g23952 [Phytophthora cactorum]KAG2879571.1 hypothetical protein PC117_g26730 [Phytophthora cactorum]KAG2957354.1 hypothetical protein PC118_g24062 [Phytophthora cactorum]